MRLAREHSQNGLSPRAANSPYIRTARGRPASRRIPPPPECLPRVPPRRSAVDGMSRGGDLLAINLRLPEDVYSRSRSFLIDQQIRALAAATGRSVALDAYWKALGVDAAVSFGRRILDVGYHAAIGPHDERQRGAWIDEWRDGAEAASEAKEALRKLIRSMSPTDASMFDIASLAVPIRQQIAYEDRSFSFKDQMKEARKRAETLLSAWEIIAAMPSYMDRRRQEIASTRQNPGEPEKAAFVRQLAEAWVLLTGRKPGRSVLPDNNPFYRLLNAAWSDLGGRDTSFEGAIRTLDVEGALTSARATGVHGF